MFPVSEPVFGPRATLLAATGVVGTLASAIVVGALASVPIVDTPMATLASLSCVCTLTAASASALNVGVPRPASRDRIGRVVFAVVCRFHATKTSALGVTSRKPAN